MGTFDIYQTDYSIHSKLSIFPWLWSHSWKYSIQPNERLTKVKEKWSTFQFGLFDLSFIFFTPCSTDSLVSVLGSAYFRLLDFACISLNCNYKLDYVTVTSVPLTRLYLDLFRILRRDLVSILLSGTWGLLDMSKKNSQSDWLIPS